MNAAGERVVLGEVASMAFWDLIEAVANWKAEEEKKAKAERKAEREREKVARAERKAAREARKATTKSVADEKTNCTKSPRKAAG